jgi:hypothetical protein
MDIAKYDPFVNGMKFKQPFDDIYITNMLTPVMYGPMTYINIGITDRMKVNNFIGSLGMRKEGDFFHYPGTDLILYGVCS